uniref:Uncharacterized protein LOC104221053 n=1 Tax=Nicotiana sylvestris TaxID=4096 RepID=A0A1U7VVD1_NICSY|nr:PREDICTED: uncharacterized protein LOC104221053 [Nicotiana sylvestris]
MVGDFYVSRFDRDIIVETKSGQLQRIKELNAAYLDLQHPLLFPFGEDGYREDIPLNGNDESSGERHFVSMREYFAYKVQERNGLKYIKTHQKQMRAHMYKGLEDAVLHGEINPSSQAFSQSVHEEDSSVVDEIKMYYDCRYISLCEATRRIFKFSIHHREPSVERLSFDLSNEQTITSSDDDPIDDVANRPSVKESQFLSWFEANKTYEEARELTYAEFPLKFVWN